MYIKKPRPPIRRFSTLIRLSKIILVTMKSYVVFAFLLVALTAVLAAPTDGGKYQERQENLTKEPVNEVHLRDKRATCRVPGIVGDWLGDAPCFVNCQLKGHQLGGNCVKGICRCIII